MTTGVFGLEPQMVPPLMATAMARILFAALWICPFADTQAEFRFSSVYGTNMVLQSAPSVAVVWGFAPPGADVTVHFDGIDILAKRDAWLEQSTWMAKLPPTPAGFTGHNISASCGGVTLVPLTGVLFGDVWVCAGQSNMNYPLNSMDPPGHPGKTNCWVDANVNCSLWNDSTPAACKARKYIGCSQCHYGCVNNSQNEIDDMGAYDSILRMNVIGPCGSHFPSTRKPLAEYSNTGWLTPSRMGGGFSAMCYFYGRDLSKTLVPRRPIGLIQAAVGGVTDQFFSSDDAIAKCQGLGQPWEWPANFRNGTGTLPSGYVLPDVPTGWNAKITPLLRTVIKGVVWYQGESNTGALTGIGSDARQYNCSLQAMITDWREKWAIGTGGASDPQFPFGWVQLDSCYKANWTYNGRKLLSGPDDPLGAWAPDRQCPGPRGSRCEGQGDGFPSVRWAMQQSLALVKTFQAISVDTPSAAGSVHSPFKQPTASRLARASAFVAYGMREYGDVNPHVKGVVLDSTKHDVLITLSGLGPGGIEVRSKIGFEILGEDDIWHSMPIASNTHDTVMISLGAILPRAVRYLWYDTPCTDLPLQCPIYTSAHALGSLSGEVDFLPLGPFIQTITVQGVTTVTI